jgi:hypothetical protein
LSQHQNQHQLNGDTIKALRARDRTRTERNQKGREIVSRWHNFIPGKPKRLDAKSITLKTLARVRSNRRSHLLLVGRQNGAGSLEDTLAISYKTEYALMMQSSSPLGFIQVN